MLSCFLMISFLDDILITNPFIPPTTTIHPNEDGDFQLAILNSFKEKALRVENAVHYLYDNSVITTSGRCMKEYEIEDGDEVLISSCLHDKEIVCLVGLKSPEEGCGDNKVRMNAVIQENLNVVPDDPGIYLKQ